MTGFVDSVVKHGVIRSVLTRTVNCIILTLDCGFVDSVGKHGVIRSVPTRTVNCIILTLDWLCR